MAYRQTPEVLARLSGNRNAILEAATRLVASQGFGAVRVTDVAREVGLASGTIYRYFPSKAALLQEVLVSVSERELERVAAIARRQGDARLRLTGALASFAFRALESPGLARALLVETLEPSLAETRLLYRRKLADILAESLADGVALGEVPMQNLSVSAACLVGALTESLAGPLGQAAGRPQAEGDRVVGEIVAFCLRAVGLKPQP